MVNWYFQSGKESDVVLDTKVTISRNIEGFPFVLKLKDEQAKEILDKVEQSSVISNYNLKMLRLSDMDELTRQSLVEKYMLNSKYVNGNLEDKAILMNDDENIYSSLTYYEVNTIYSYFVYLIKKTQEETKKKVLDTK